MSVLSLARCHVNNCNSLFILVENYKLTISFKTRVFQRRTHFSCGHNENGRVLISRLLDNCSSRFRPRVTLSHSQPLDVEYDRLLSQFIDETGLYSVRRLFAYLKSCGIQATDQRIVHMLDAIRAELKPEDSLKDLTCGIAYAKLNVDLTLMKRFIAPNFSLVYKALKKELIIPDFEVFKKEIKELYTQCKTNTTGKVASYIPQLALVDPDKWAVSICTIDGQRSCFGDKDMRFTIQSCSKPFVYGLALEKLGRDRVHEYVGHEPSGRGFNELVLNPEGLPHNPMINSGAIITCAVLNTLAKDYASNELSVKFDSLVQYFGRMAGAPVGFCNSVYLSEKNAADRNYALAYYMKENKQVGRSCFPPDANFHECIDIYFMTCSLESTCKDMAVMAATLANGGVCPVTNDKVGAPSKSGVSGCVIMVIPNKLGICCYSPRLDNLGNSARGIQFAKLVSKKYQFHSYDTVRNCSVKTDPTIRRATSSVVQHASLMYAAHHGDIGEIRFQQLCGENVAQSDFQGRTALHAAATQGHLECVQYLLESCKVPAEPEDIWGNKPLDEAVRFGHPMVAEFIKEWISASKRN